MLIKQQTSIGFHCKRRQKTVKRRKNVKNKNRFALKKRFPKCYWATTTVSSMIFTILEFGLSYIIFSIVQRIALVNDTTF